MADFNQEKINVLVQEYEEKRSLLEELEEQVKSARAEKEAAEKAVIMSILEAEELTGVEDMKVLCHGRRYGAAVKTYFTIPKEAREQAFEELRALGHGDLIVERVDDRTLSKELQGVISAYRATATDADDFPPEYAPLMSMVTRYDKPSLSRTLAK